MVGSPKLALESSSFLKQMFGVWRHDDERHHGDRLLGFKGRFSEEWPRAIGRGWIGDEREDGVLVLM